jgi:hypothetical protein
MLPLVRCGHVVRALRASLPRMGRVPAMPMPHSLRRHRNHRRIRWMVLHWRNDRWCSPKGHCRLGRARRSGVARTAWSSGRAGLQQSSSSGSSMGVPNDALKRITDSRKCAQARPLGSSQFCRPRRKASSLAMSRIGADRPPSDRFGFRGTILKAGYPLAAGQMRSDIFEKWHRTSCEEQHEKGPRPTVRRTVGGPPCAISVPGDRSFGSDDATRVIIQECFKASMEQVGRRVCSVGEVKADLRLARRRDLKRQRGPAAGRAGALADQAPAPSHPCRSPGAERG